MRFVEENKQLQISKGNHVCCVLLQGFEQQYLNSLEKKWVEKVVIILYMYRWHMLCESVGIKTFYNVLLNWPSTFNSVLVCQWSVIWVSGVVILDFQTHIFAFAGVIQYNKIWIMVLETGNETLFYIAVDLTMSVTSNVDIMTRWYKFIMYTKNVVNFSRNRDEASPWLAPYWRCLRWILLLEHVKYMSTRNDILAVAGIISEVILYWNLKLSNQYNMII